MTDINILNVLFKCLLQAQIKKLEFVTFTLFFTILTNCNFFQKYFYTSFGELILVTSQKEPKSFGTTLRMLFSFKGCCNNIGSYRISLMKDVSHQTFEYFQFMNIHRCILYIIIKFPTIKS